MTPLARAGTALAILWVAWVASWGMASWWTAKTVIRQSFASRLAHGVLIWIGAMLLFMRPRLLGPLWVAPFPASVWTAWAGVVLCALGFAFTWWARVHLGRNWSGTVTLKADHALIRTGPYALTRHPIYTGLLLAIIGSAITRDSLAGGIGLGFLVAGLLVKIRQEERLLLEHFGPAYEAYRAEVPALVPRFRRR
jgi:protein-S-isoprenylcysteine O-methyltransferase Ste14